MMRRIINGEKGQALPLALAILALGALIITPSLGLASSTLAGSRTYGRAITERYSADAGVEHAIWQLKYNGLADSLTTENPTVDYSIAVNNMTADITVTRIEDTFPPEPPPPPEGSQAWRIQVAKSVEPDSAPPGQPTTFTYTIYIENVSTSEVHLEEVGDMLPVGFVYTGTISGLITTAELTQNLVDGQWELVWAFSPPLPVVSAGETATQVFQATATLEEEDIYWNTAWVVASPDSIGEISTGSAAPVGESPYVYDIVCNAEGTSVHAQVSISDTGVSILLWEIE